MKCKIVGCSKPHRAKNLCSTHYTRLRRTGTTDEKQRKLVPKQCTVKGCGIRIGAKTGGAKGLCQLHYRRVKRTGITELRSPDEINTARLAARKKSPPKRPIGKITIEKSGYARIVTENGYPYEHRYVMEQFLGRKLHSFESVHHRNGQRADNRLENLELWTTHQWSGQRVDDLVDFVKTYYSDKL